MSIMPDTRQGAHIEVPANAPHELSRALAALLKVHPEMGVYRGHFSSLWERNYTMTAEGGAYLARLILKDLEERGATDLLTS
ncbi:hypothetical protein HOU02_gp327 [Caulobacter phage CcrBL9]|uniref:Uncharacterized protein n=1 Tax=Caulobacter phage CcrBL9 TaxID=2283270 RepID=A0A385EF51_9CAUD|nr:hypothetical protein HOU02_gp327 [Caulobacter phage CcrBL9]AXQ69398.1 hypothetical protein CcrBL9_gp374 [Caulobacter phage CcrBL9]